LQKLKNECAGLKASNDNHVFINDKLNKALMKALQAKKEKMNKHERQHTSESQKVENGESKQNETDAQGSGS
jgi:hypothetical protein